MDFCKRSKLIICYLKVVHFSPIGLRKEKVHSQRTQTLKDTLTKQQVLNTFWKERALWKEG